jgi:hypothetical protein
MGERYDVVVGTQLRHAHGAGFALVCMDSDGPIATWPDCLPNPKKIPRAKWPKLRDALLRAACVAVGIDVPRFSESDWRRVYSAAGWLCRPDRMCRECSEKRFLGHVTGGLSIDEFLSL